MEPEPTPPVPDKRFPSFDLGWARSPRARRRLAKIAGVVVALLVVVPLVLWSYYQATHVITRNAQVKGYITSVGSQIDGVVTSVEVETGQRVVAGQLLARFEDRQLRASVERAQSKLTKATRELEVERMAIEQERQRLAGLIAETSARTEAAMAKEEAARTQAEDAASKFELRQRLAKDGLIPPEELQTAETTKRTAAAMAQTAQADRSAAVATQRLAVVESKGLAVRQRHLQVMYADIAALEAELSSAEADLKATEIRAPENGWVVRRIAEAGASVVVGQPIVALWIGKDVWVEAWINEDDLANVRVGNAARVRVKPYPHRVFTGVVETVGVSTDYELPDAAVPEPRGTRMRAAPVVCVRIRLSHSDGLFPGLSAVVGIQRKAAG